MDQHDMVNPLCISRLIESGLSVFIPLDGSSRIIIEQSDKTLASALCCNASQDENGACVFKCPPSGPMLTVVCDPITRTVWLLPQEIMQERVSLRLGKKCDDYILPEPLSLSFTEQKMLKEQKLRDLRAIARDRANKLIQQEKENEQ